MRVRLFVVLSVAAGLFGGAVAQARPGSAPVRLVAKPITMTPNSFARLGGERVANLMIYTANEPNLPWIGRGAATKTVSLCIASTTGRYRLVVSSRMGGAARGVVRIPYTIRFTDGVGTQSTASTDRSSTLVFEGSAPAGADCLGGPNATLSIRMDEQSLLSGAAGNYADNIQFAVQPL